MKPLATLILAMGLLGIALGLIWSQPFVTRCGATALVLGAVVGQVPARKPKARPAAAAPWGSFRWNMERSAAASPVPASLKSVTNPDVACNDAEPQAVS